MIHRPRYVKAFLAIVGPEPAQAPRCLPEPLRDLEPVVFATPQVCVYSFGSSTPTLDPAPDLAAPAWIKGRPFSLASAPGLEALGEPGASVAPSLQNLDGKFSLLAARLDGGLLAATDLLGSSSVYYHARAGRLYLSSHVGLLLAALPTAPAYDQLGLASLLALRRCLHDGTVWEGVSALPGGHYLSVGAPPGEPPSWSIGSYGAVTELLAGPARTGTLEALAREYDELVRQSLRRERTGGPVALMLSGGHDSPVFALSLHNDGRTDFTAVTFGRPRSGDVRGATALAQRLRIPHVLVPYGDWDLSTYAGRIASLNGGLTSLEFGYQLPGYEFASGEFRVAIVGHLGNLLSLPGLSEPWKFEERWSRYTRFWGVPNPLVEQYYSSELAEVRELLRRQMDQVGRLPPNQAWIACAARSTGWQSLNFDVAEIYLEISYPFYYRPLLSFVFNLSVGMLKDQQLYDAWYRQAYERATGTSGLSVGAHRSGGQEPPVASAAPRRDTPLTVDWRARMRRSAVWLFDSIDRHCDDPRLRNLARASLESHLARDGTRVPVVLNGLAPCLAKSLLWSQASNSRTGRVRALQTLRRAASLLRLRAVGPTDGRQH